MSISASSPSLLPKQQVEQVNPLEELTDDELHQLEAMITSIQANPQATETPPTN